MKLYVCYGLFHSPRPGGHPCRNAHQALRKAGYAPEVVRTYGLGPLPAITPGRRKVKELTGQTWVPVLVTDDGEAIHESKTIVAWAQAHPAGGSGGHASEAA
ncbi:MAG TPA: glutathione S-transferase N-terminal domain-containing protein [Conexibacter sp.]|nr:glutathione S-transferase N-terminal domain-containing protein [Conexibacter sp.]